MNKRIEFFYLGHTAKMTKNIFYALINLYLWVIFINIGCFSYLK